MGSAFNSTNVYLKVLTQLNATYPDVQLINKLEDFVRLLYKSDLGNSYSEPMVWIGMYIALASLYCILAMAADLIHGLKNTKLWFPCKYFTINAFTLTVIAIAMKLPVDLTGPMPGVVDRVAKLGSVAFMCTMMANLLPCLAIMDNNSLLSNITALTVLVITLVVNVYIQIQTGVVESCGEDTIADIKHTVLKGSCDGSLFWVLNKISYSTIAAIYVAMLLMLLLIYAASVLAILDAKEIIEKKYKECHDEITTSRDHKNPKGPDQRALSTVAMLYRYVSKYWIMEGSGNPQFIVACFTTTTASGVICGLTTILHTLTMVWTTKDIIEGDFDSDYKTSMPVILVVQSIGVILGSVAPCSRCFAPLSLKLYNNRIWNRMKFYKVESYWTQKLREWKDDSMPYPFRSYKRMRVLKKLQSLILIYFINLQRLVVVECKIIALIPFFGMVCFMYCSLSFKWLWNLFGSVGVRESKVTKRDGGCCGVCVSITMPEWGEKKIPPGKKINPYVLQLEDEVELADRTLEGLQSSLDQLIKKSERKQPTNLLDLMSEESTRCFQGALKFENDDCGSLVVVNLTTILVTLCRIQKDPDVDRLLKGVREGLEYVTLVERNTGDHVNNQKVAERLWQEVDVSHKWLGNCLDDIVSEGKPTRETVGSFLKMATKDIKIEDVGSKDDEGPIGDSNICVESMSHKGPISDSMSRKGPIGDSNDFNICAESMSHKRPIDDSDICAESLSRKGPVGDSNDSNICAESMSHKDPIDDSNICAESLSRKGPIGDSSDSNICAESMSRKGSTSDSNYSNICAESMSHIINDIIKLDHIESHKNLVNDLKSTVAKLLAACLTKLPEVIAMKCHTTEIEKREASVKAAAKLLGETKKIIEFLEKHAPSVLPFSEP